MSELEISAKGSALCVFIVSIFAGLLGKQELIVVPVLPFIIGYRTLKEKDIFHTSFLFMIFNVAFSLISLVLFSNGIYVDVLFPRLFFFSIFSPFFFSLGGFANKKTYILYLSIVLVVIAILFIFTKPGEPSFYSSLNFFYLYDAFLAINQIWLVLKKKQSKTIQKHL